MKNIADSLEIMRSRLAAAEAGYGRTPGSVQLLAVSKTRQVEEIRAALEAGQFDFGENYLQEALDKIQSLADERATWHFIGPVQSNKTRAIAGHFHWVHSIDRARIAQRLSSARPDHMPSLNICLQVNISGEESRAGIHPPALPELLEECVRLPGIRVRGLMTMPEIVEDFDKQRKAFRQLQTLQERLVNEGYHLDTLSMGTTHDYRAAIAEGSTMVRIGTAIFGRRE